MQRKKMKQINKVIKLLKQNNQKLLRNQVIVAKASKVQKYKDIERDMQ
jgi:hypothetical protein